MNINEDYIKRFNDRSASMPLKALFHNSIGKFITDRINGHSVPLHLLEIGTGTGYWIKELELTLEQEKFAKLLITGYDIDKELIKFANQWKGKYSNIEFTDFPVDESGENKYDLIFLIDVYQHFPVKDRFNMLLKIHDRLAENGRIIIIDKELFTFYGLKTTLMKKTGMLPEAWRSAKYFSFNLLHKRLSEKGIDSSILQEGHFRAIVIQ